MQNQTHSIENTTKNSTSFRVLFIEDLAVIIGKNVTTIRNCVGNKKYQHLVPIPFKMPNSRRLCWYEHEVMLWIESNKPANPPPIRRPRRRPTKLEQLAWIERSGRQQ